CGVRLEPGRAHRLDVGAAALGEVVDEVHAPVGRPAADPRPQVHVRTSGTCRHAVGVDLDATVADPGVEVGQSVLRVERRDAGAQVEVPQVQRTDDLAVDHPTVSDLAAAVRTGPADGVDPVAVAHEGHVGASHDHGLAVPVQIGRAHV